MRKITKDSVEAFLNNRNFKRSNTETISGSTGYMYLHENLIARKHNDLDGTIEVSLAGWNTKTTRERLNGIPGVNIHTVKGVPILNGQIIEANKIYTV